MKKIEVKVLNRDGSVARRFTQKPEDLGIEGGGWDENDVDIALDCAREKMPAAFALNDGSIGEYGFEVYDDCSEY